MSSLFLSSFDPPTSSISIEVSLRLPSPKNEFLILAEANTDREIRNSYENSSRLNRFELFYHIREYHFHPICSHCYVGYDLATIRKSYGTQDQGSQIVNKQILSILFTSAMYTDQSVLLIFNNLVLLVFFYHLQVLLCTIFEMEGNSFFTQ